MINLYKKYIAFNDSIYIDSLIIIYQKYYLINIHPYLNKIYFYLFCQNLKILIQFYWFLISIQSSSMY